MVGGPEPALQEVLQALARTTTLPAPLTGVFGIVLARCVGSLTAAAAASQATFVDVAAQCAQALFVLSKARDSHALFGGGMLTCSPTGRPSSGAAAARGVGGGRAPGRPARCHIQRRSHWCVALWAAGHAG
jgi:hypothetical protein